MNNEMSSRILAVDWGAKRIGLALSDPTRTIASPLTVILHTSREQDAQTIADTACEKDAALILVGVTYDLENELTPAGRSATRLAEAIRAKTDIEVDVYSEEGSTQAARQSRLQMGLPKNKRKGHFDQIAAAIFLQRYLDEGK
jgi:putative holliday junction resolvase